MLQLTEDEFNSLRFQSGTSTEKKGGRRYLPFVFTEHGVLMLSSVLNNLMDKPQKAKTIGFVQV